MAVIRRADKYRLYEASVQSPIEDVELFVMLYRQARGREPRRLREDFCGTFKFACEFVKRDAKNSAEVLDLDPEPLGYGRRNNLKELTPAERKRVKVLRRNVISVSRQKADLVVANNFSFYVFRDRPTLLRYFKAVRRSLGPRGALFLEMVGGPGFVEKTTERRTIKVMGRPKYRYIWDQRRFDPVTREGHYSIHFLPVQGSRGGLRHAFTYHWRIWTIPEVRDVLREAGFRDTAVFWETCHRGKETGEFVRTEKGDNDWTWLCYVAGLR